MGPFKISNVQKPSNKTWKFVSKFLTRTLPVYAGIIAAIPEEVIPNALKVWLGVALSTVVATISGLSEFTTETEKIDDRG